jgi:hypothetical protein
MRRTLALTLIAACGTSSPPDEPSWQVDVMPLFAANCVRCHAYPFRGGGTRDDGTPRTSALRLDSFDDTELADGNVASGAAKSVQAIFRHTHGIALLPGQRVMPPDRPLDDYELAVIRNWAALGNGEIAVRGPGRADNHAAEVAVTELARDAATITMAYDVRDADGDLVVGTVLGPRLVNNVLDPAAVVGNVIAGRDQFVWDIAGVPAGDYAIKAQLDDGADVDPEGPNDFVAIDLGMITIP